MDSRDATNIKLPDKVMKAIKFLAESIPYGSLKLVAHPVAQFFERGYLRGNIKNVRFTQVTIPFTHLMYDTSMQTL